MSMLITCFHDFSPLPAALYEFRVQESLAAGSVVGVVRAVDADIGVNAEMEYRLIGSEGPGVFDIVTNRSNQEGWLVLRKVGPTTDTPIAVAVVED